MTFRFPPKLYTRQPHTDLLAQIARHTPLSAADIDLCTRYFHPLDGHQGTA